MENDFVCFRMNCGFVMKKLLLIALFLLSGCFQKPFIDARRQAGSPRTFGESTPNRIAVCYNPLSTNANEIIKLAQEACGKTNREAAYDGHKYWSCRVFWPHRVYYRCQEIPEEKTDN